jgi:hypothetical protein
VPVLGEVPAVLAVPTVLASLDDVDGLGPTTGESPPASPAWSPAKPVVVTEGAGVVVAVEDCALSVVVEALAGRPFVPRTLAGSG